MKLTIAFGAIALALTTPAHAQMNPDWTTPTQPFCIAGNVYYVGTKGIGAYLIVAGKQAILLDGGLEADAPLIEANIKALGFRPGDVKIILNSHAHFDHAGGIARLKRDTGAAFYASPGDRWALEHGLHDGETDYPRGRFPAVHVDHVLKDGERVALGGVRMKATFTPGHTKGCTTWSTEVIVPNRVLTVVFPCSLSTGGNILVGNRAYPGIVKDYEQSFATVGAMKADIVLTNHPEIADVLGREARVKAGQADAFVDPHLLGRIVADARDAFEKERTRQAKGNSPRLTARLSGLKPWRTSPTLRKESPMTVINLTPQEVHEALDSGQAVLVDVREPSEFAAERIEGAINLPLSSFDPAALPVNDGKRVILSCAGGVRSVTALNAAQGAGLSLEEHLAGGLRAWKAAGLPTES